jgi:multidrug transporter EmrE-like cation transporter
MARAKDYLMLHICILVFSFTSVFSKAAANRYNAAGFGDKGLFFFAFLMLSVCAIYAFFWQRVIKNIPLNVAYANRSAYLVWGQVWAVSIYGEHLSLRNIIGLITVIVGVITVSYFSDYEEEANE